MLWSLSAVYRSDWMELDILLCDLRQLGNISMIPYNLIYLLLLGCTLENKRKGNMIVNKSRNIKQQLSIRTFEALILQRTLLLTNLPDQVKNKTERREVKNKLHYEICLSVFYSLADVNSETYSSARFVHSFVFCYYPSHEWKPYPCIVSGVISLHLKNRLFS